MSIQEQFRQKSIKERILLKKVLTYIPFEYKSYMTDETGFDPYDCLLYLFKDDKFIQRKFIEVKVRDRHYLTLMLEKNKLKNLISLVKQKDLKFSKDTLSDEKSGIVYLSITPYASYWFDLDKINLKELEWVNEMHWVSTTDQSKGKIMKEVTYLDINLATKYEVTSNTIEDKDDVKIEKIMDNQRKYKCLFEYLIRTEE